MYVVKYETMFIPCLNFFATKEEAEAFKKRVEQKLPGVEVTISGGEK